MADTKSLRLIGYGLSAVTMLVIVFAATLVVNATLAQSELQQSMQVGEGPHPASDWLVREAGNARSDG